MVAISQSFRINGATANRQHDVQFATLNSGTIVAVWTSEDGSPTGSNIMARLFDHTGAPLGAEFKVNTERPDGLWPSVYYQYAPDVAALSDGGFVVSYGDNRASDGSESSPVLRRAIVVQRYDAQGEKVGTDRTHIPSIDTQGNSMFPNDAEIVAAGTGYTIVYDSDRYVDGTVPNQDYNGGVYMSGFSLNGAIDPVHGGDRFGITTVNTVVSGKQDASKVEALLDSSGYANGNSVVVWFTDAIAGTPPDGINTPSQLKAQIISPTGARIGSEITLPRLAALDNYRGDTKYDVAALPGGSFIVAWQSTNDILFQIVNADGSMRGAITAAHAPDAGTQIAPAVAGRFDGSFLITWTDNADYYGSGRIVGQLFKADGSKDGELLVFSTGASNNYATVSQIVSTSVGTYLVAWNDGADVGDSDGIAAVMVDPSGTGGGTPPGGTAPKASVIGSASVKEGTGGQTSYEFTVKLDRPATSAVSVDYTISGTGASPANTADFSFATFPYSGTVTFQPGHDQITVPVPIVSDSVAEGDETFQIALSNPTGSLTIAQGNLAVTLVDDDSAPGAPLTVRISGPSRVEDGGTAEYIVSLNRASTEAENVRVSTAGFHVSPAGGDDFASGVYPFFNLDFQPGETTKTVRIETAKNPVPTNGASPEPDEIFVVWVEGQSANFWTGQGPLIDQTRVETTIIGDGPVSPAVVQAAPMRILGVEASDAKVATLMTDVSEGRISLDAAIDQMIAMAGTSSLPAVVVGRALGDAWPSAEQHLRLIEFSKSQFASYTQQGVGRPELGPYEALGVGFSELASFNTRFGHISDEDFPKLAYELVFGRAPSAAQAAHFFAQNAFFERLYLGVGQTAAQADIHAKGAVIGQMLGFAVLDEPELHGYDDAASSFLQQAAKGYGAYGMTFDLV